MVTMGDQARADGHGACGGTPLRATEDVHITPHLINNHENEPSLSQSMQINGVVGSILSQGDAKKVYYFPGDAKGCLNFAKTDASSSSTCIVQSVEATSSVMNVDKTRPEQEYQLQRKPLNSKENLTFW